MVSAQMAGDGETALRAAENLADLAATGRMNEAPWVQPIIAAPYFLHAQFSDPAQILTLPDPGDRRPYVKAMWHYVRGLGAAHSGDLPTAEATSGAIDRLARTADVRALEEAGVPARAVIELAGHVLRARIAQIRGAFAAAVTQYEAAVALEDGLPYLEPPYWYYPVRQSLAAARLQTGDIDGAIVAFRKSLEQAPNNAWALFGLAEGYRRQGKEPEARDADARFQRAWLGPSGQLALGRL
jgi:tetratricopeptide (TPR) repeat protein